MKLHLIHPKQAISLALRRQRPNRSDLERFKTGLKGLLDKMDNEESEEHQKNNVRDFLNDTGYKPSYYINTKDREDLAIYLGKTHKDKVGVIIETKAAGNTAEMPEKDKPNCKALQQLVLYYMRERTEENNIDLKHLIITNSRQWYIFEAAWFEKRFYRNAPFKKEYEEWRDGKKTMQDTAMFYKDIAKPCIDKIDEEVTCAFFDLEDYQKALEGKDDKNLVALFKILSPNHLLKTSFEDSNKLDERFYKELLHIIGLEEAKEGGKYIIDRKKETDRNPGSLMENAMAMLEAEDALRKVPGIEQYGETRETKLFNIALELCITWINRILFLKLLEGQLLSYHTGRDGAANDYRFLDTQTIPNYGELFKLFHRVLAVDIPGRDEALKKKYSRVPYLNSSLFEISELEDVTLKINSLDADAKLELFSATILKQDKKKDDKLPALDYLFKFLNAYDFASENADADIQEDNKTLINASVLGKVFEKINGYKDGSVFTPGFITMYMCRQAIRLAVLQKFKEKYNWKVEEFDELKYPIKDDRSKKKILEFNALINSLHICDPAVGSGHFLVSALNELIAIKSELGILADANGGRLDCLVQAENDELYIEIEREGGQKDFFEYKVFNGDIPEKLQKIQETIFHEKQTIIENCLFGVDINPNSVKICRLRLWIELLKNAYYKKDGNYTNLETLPNIDINIKCGNSLISRFTLDADLSRALKSIKYNIETYRGYVNEYKNAKDREFKRGIEKLIKEIKTNFRTEISNNDPKIKKLQKLQYEFNQLVAPNIFKEEEVDYGNKNYKKDKAEKIKKLETEINKLSQEVDNIKNSAIYRNAMEWRFEFPEVLNDNGDFEGFDVVIGNPPYISVSLDSKMKPLYGKYLSYSSTGDIYSLFYELGQGLLKKDGIETLIISNKWMRANYGAMLRSYMYTHSNPIKIIDFGQNLLFDTAIVHTVIIISTKAQFKNNLSGARFDDNSFSLYKDNFSGYIESHLIHNIIVSKDIWNIISDKIEKLKTKIEKIGTPIGKWKILFNYGIKTGYNEAFIIDETIKNELIKEDKKNSEIIKPILRGRDTRRYYCNFANLYMIATFPTLNIDIEKYPMVRDYLLKFGKNRLEQSGNFGSRKKTKNKWFETQDSIAYWNEFKKPKIIFSEIVSTPQFYYDIEGYYPEATCFFMSGNGLKYLTALLNSKPITFFFKSFYMGGELVGKIRYKKAFVEKIPIPQLNEKQQKPFISIVDKILALKKQGKDTTELEAQIDKMVYELYDLTPEEIKIVEGK